ncbi:DUF2975 domain-containing protein [Gelria sp. Kuro-4]|uniref:DUF2975 domain-containing protein n=1 Tax=Gelria sp. Kuro-4 TaxID=2796927 RepID=UPI001BEDAA00|nr:DUF2975 domain-containing protein [Gelria sp. Kuro-4]BCV24402.1 hypothetical protein kuro4_11750 [Gelria sp. Kuro-4]
MRYLGRRSVSSVLSSILTVVWYFSWVAAVVLVIGQLYGVVRDGSVLGQLKLQINTPGLTISFAELAHPVPRGILLFSAGALLPLFAVYLIIIYQLRKILATLVAETPFTAANATHIWWIGITVIVGSVVKSIVVTAFGFFFAQNIPVPGVDFGARLSLDFTPIFLGLVILVLAEIFRQGAALQEEQDLTV